MIKFFNYILVFLLLTSLAFSQENSVAPDEPFQKAQYNFTGAWLPDLDAAEIGPSNFRKLQNMRYAEKHPEGVLGYSKINSTALTTYTSIRSGIQLKSDRTVASYVLVHSENTGETASQVFQNQAVVPAQGDFEATALHTDATGAGLGRFAIVADGHAAYANGVETMVWAGEEMRVAGFFSTYDSSQTLPVDYTDEVNNTLTSTGNTVTIGVNELITNGNMEADSNWADEGTVTQSQSGTQKYSGTFSRTFSADAADEGAEDWVGGRAPGLSASQPAAGVRGGAGDEAAGAARGGDRDEPRQHESGAFWALDGAVGRGGGAGCLLHSHHDEEVASRDTGLGVGGADAGG